ncbi:hypothetical protein DWX43_19280 [Clostridium sp. AF19-22AC]|jgi:hypothetical protein|uniref:hypothetical protein n=1 Tax=Clostridia TaxID=186801 RepID=UPI000E4CCB25|nr:MULTISPECIES: hypothetical protein [Clostridia]RHR24786.1 hypothetical protein DWX43_19280 [Clostridium sp. AF19-22AC]DAQ34332.1 MAG TPA: tail protein [Caudoviricetes sp.]
MEVRFVNHEDKGIDLNTDEVILQYHEFFDYSWDSCIKNNKILDFTRNTATIPITVAVVPETQERYFEILEELYQITESDILSKQMGRLYVGGGYMQCYISGVKKIDIYNNIPLQIQHLTIVTDYPFWMKEKKYSYRKYDGTPEQYEYLDYNYDYNYDLTPRSAAEYLLNEHYAACSFKMVIYGPVESPRIEIKGHLYEIVTTLTDYEYVVLDSRNRTIYQVNRLGGVKNIYNSQNKESYVFEKIPAGRNLVNWNRKFGFDITLYEERSEPAWT